MAAGDTSDERAFHFDGYTLDLRRGSLLRGDRDVELRPKSFALLRYLVENAGRLVSKDELIRAIWPNVTVTDESLTRCVSDVRIALGDHGQRMIKTVPRRGYMFAAPVSARATELEPPAPPPLSLVVLPFVNLGGGSQDCFADALTETLTTDLFHILDTAVIARDTAFTFKDKHVDARAIGRELGVRYVIEGSVQVAGDIIRINAQLIDADTRTHLWAERFDLCRANPLLMQDRISAQLRRALQIELIHAESRRAGRPPRDPVSAIDLATRGWETVQQAISAERAREARGLFEAALRLDPCHLSSLLGLALALLRESTGYACANPRGQLRLAEAAITEALKLAPGNARAHSICALVFSWSDPRRAQRELEIAQSLDPRLAYLHTGFGLVKMLLGRAEDTEAHVTETIRLVPGDPDLGMCYLVLGGGDLHLGRFEQAAERLRLSVELNPGFGLPWFYLAASEAALGREHRAAEARAMGRRLTPGFTVGKLQVVSCDNDIPAFQDQRASIVNALRKAGVPE